LFLIPPIKSLAFKHLAHYSKLIAVILLLGEIMPLYSCYKEKELVYIVIIAPSNHQPSSCSECTVLNIHLSCNIQLISDTECIYLAAYFYTL
jgi:hypothetical protein